MLQVLLADREGRLAWGAPHEFAILQPPAGCRRVHGRGSSVLRALNSSWDVLVFMAVMLVLLGIATALSIAAPSTRQAGLWLAVGVVAVVAAAMLMVSITQVRELVTGGRRRQLTALGAVESRLWSVALCHVMDPARVQPLLETARARIASGEQHLFCAATAVTTAAARTSLAQVTEPLTTSPSVRILLGSDDPRLEEPGQQHPRPGRGLGFLLGASAIVVAVVAQQVSREEQRLCVGTQSCASVPTGYGDALYWSISRVLGGDPEGLGVAAVGSRVVGLLLTFYGLFILAFILDKVLERRIAEDAQSAAELVEQFNDRVSDRIQTVVEQGASPLPSRAPDVVRVPGVIYFLVGMLTGLSTKIVHVRLGTSRRPDPRRGDDRSEGA
ncbi:hypothetical protein [Geodermatophilus siccatus]|uniref:hypothetical protein n=1 Tax=Geodermatophilus siccatus TaxID=1137991 RepID=UPI001113931A|nr:hypothetical protein [Geodermatophilus siccatus]